MRSDKRADVLHFVPSRKTPKGSVSQLFTSQPSRVTRCQRQHRQLRALQQLPRHQQENIDNLSFFRPFPSGPCGSGSHAHWAWLGAYQLTKQAVVWKLL
ncbi:uncharacterized protein UV8b_06385 [Ustilaginoidea virens]|uniref:Uncharacterized protein n=1 Tax=Ustilaginoidea virens TaxID=1159556 RepID=A0A8E5HV16_USTVR|nr:uncharacterized protein UV8b_06385 [Ustilaginoidea virens]QUC22144.1 hypothetical protein UV8b_06385 [Ustilaginoidea virens]